MQVKELLDKKGHDVYSVSPDATVYDALQLMAEKEIGALVCSKTERWWELYPSAIMPARLSSRAKPQRRPRFGR